MSRASRPRLRLLGIRLPLPDLSVTTSWFTLRASPGEVSESSGSAFPTALRRKDGSAGVGERGEPIARSVEELDLNRRVRSVSE